MGLRVDFLRFGCIVRLGTVLWWLRSIIALLWGLGVSDMGPVLKRLRLGLGLMVRLGTLLGLRCVRLRLILRRLWPVTLVVVVGSGKRGVRRRVGVMMRLDISRT